MHPSDPQQVLCDIRSNEKNCSVKWQSCNPPTKKKKNCNKIFITETTANQFSFTGIDTATKKQLFLLKGLTTLTKPIILEYHCFQETLTLKESNGNLNVKGLNILNHSMTWYSGKILYTYRTACVTECDDQQVTGKKLYAIWINWSNPKHWWCLNNFHQLHCMLPLNF
jgi:hypothetical protein